MIKVAISGAAGRMGSETVRAVAREKEFKLVAAIDKFRAGEDVGIVAGIEAMGVAIEPDLEMALRNSQPDVVVDFTNPESVLVNIQLALNCGVRPVVGTTGLSETNIATIDEWCRQANLSCLIAPNFAIGAILMMRFAVEAAKYLPHVEIIELHHDQKLDAPSGTAIKTAEAINKVRESFHQGHFNEEEKIEGARGGDYEGMRIHSVRLPGFVAHQEVIFGGLGQILTLRHDSINRESFMPGVILAVKEVVKRQGVIYGLEQVMP